MEEVVEEKERHSCSRKGERKKKKKVVRSVPFRREIIYYMKRRIKRIGKSIRARKKTVVLSLS